MAAGLAIQYDTVITSVRATSLQPFVSQPATVTFAAWHCSSMSLRPFAAQRATVRIAACNRNYSSQQPYVSQVEARPGGGMRAVTRGGTVHHANAVVMTVRAACHQPG